MSLERERQLEDAGRKLYAMAAKVSVNGPDELGAKLDALKAWEEVMLGAPGPHRTM